MAEKKSTLNFAEFIHPADAKTLEALKKIPFFDKVCSKFISVFRESFLRVYDMSSKIKITEKQLPELHDMLMDICGKLNIDVPDFYLELNPIPNAYTYGDESATITVTSGLLEAFTNKEIYAVIAHECGHIACKHVLYSTMAQFIVLGGESISDAIFGDNIITNAVFIPIKLALAHWYRCSELSADRIAALCCGNTEIIVKVMARLCGGTLNDRFTIDYRLFANQAGDYRQMLEENKINKLIEFIYIANASHPLAAVRAYEITDWGNGDSFKKNAFPKKADYKEKKVGFFKRLFGKNKK